MASWAPLIKAIPLTREMQIALFDLGATQYFDTEDQLRGEEGAEEEVVVDAAASRERAAEEERPEVNEPDKMGKRDNHEQLGFGDRTILMRRMLKRASGHAAPHEMEVSMMRRQRQIEKSKTFGGNR